jgi:inorganic pyrophosphatase
MRDEHGDDEKILAVPVGDPRFDEVRGESTNSSEVKGWHDADVAWKLIGDARARARKTS